MHTSTHNLLKGTVAKVKKGEATAVVLLDLGGAIVAASLTISRLTISNSRQGLRRMS
jgi:molybdopterin-binding protein